MKLRSKFYLLLATVIASFTLALTATPASAAVTVSPATNYRTRASFIAPATYDPSGASKLVVVVTGEHNFSNNTGGQVTNLTFGGVPMIQAVDRNPTSASSILAADIWYLDNPGTTAGSFAVTVGGNGTNYVFTVFHLTGTAPGHEATAISAENSKSVSLTTTAPSSLVVASHALGGDGNTGQTSGVTVISPAVKLTNVNTPTTGNIYVGQCVSTTYPVAAAGTASYEFAGGSATGCVTIAVEFKDADASPTIITLAPADNASGVPVDANLVATFSEDIALGTGEITLKNLTTSTASTITLPDPQVSVSGSVLTINPTADLVQGHQYGIQIASTAIKDLAENSFAGIADDTTWNFTAFETIPPTLVSIGDDKGGASILANTLVTYTVAFNEDMDATTVSAADFGNAGTAAFTIGTITETTPGIFSVEVTPTSSGTLTLQLVSGAVVADGSGNALVITPVNDDTTLSVFNTVAYWDLDGLTAGAGGATPSGTWNAANPFWNASADGTASTIPWVQGQVAVFAAGSQASGAYSVTVDGTQDIGGLTFEEGSVTLNGGTALRLVANSTAEVAAGLTATVATPITQDASTRSLTKSGPGTLTLSAANTYTGATTIGEGTLAFTTTDPFLTGGLTFGSANGSTFAGTLDLSTASATVDGALLVRTNTATANTITLAADKTLTLNAGITLGYDAASGTGQSDSKLTLSGGGNLAVNGTTLNISVNQAATNAAYWSKGTLDVSGLSAFNTNVTTFNIGVGITTHGPGDVILSNTANTILATTLAVGDTGGNNGRGTSTLTLGTGTNAIQANTIYIGRQKSSGPGVVKFASQTAGSPGTVSINNKVGTGRANLDIANQLSNATAGGAIGTLDLRGHIATVSAGTVTIGATAAASNAGGSNGTLFFDAGSFDVNTLSLATKSGAGTGTSRGTLNIGGGTFTVNTTFTLGSQISGGASVATLNLTGGTLNSTANILEGGGNTTSVLNLDGGILDLNGNAIGGANAIDTLEFKSGELRNVSQINDGATPLTKSSAGKLLLSGTNTYSGGTTVNAGTLTAGSPSAFGSGPVSVGNGATLDLGGQNLNNLVTLPVGSTLTGAGTINAPSDTVAGTVSPGNGTGTITFSNTSLTLSGIVNLEIGGTTAGLYDSVSANGPMTLSGVVTVSFTNGFTPAASQSWDFFSEDGSFTSTATLNLPSLPPGLAWNSSAFASTGGLSIVLSGNTYADWQSSKFSPAELLLPLVSGDNADPDGDGLSNAMEFAFGTEPRSSTSNAHLPKGSLVGENFTISYRRPVGGVSGVTYAVQLNTNLVSGGGNWTPAASPADYTQSASPNGDGSETVTITFAGTASGKKFARVSASF